ncbi:DUF4159 domain-containing protein [Alloyangia pacifica]|uniref:DUF4159 domain-containing protein n=1 Tax=Alloyangia pacifica TaxID=311180 RepID=UPI00267FCAAA
MVTGDAQLDDLAQNGLRGLSETLYYRTSVEPAEPMAVNLESDELAFFPLLYWPITPSQPTPSPAAYAKLNEYLRSGGMILFDTRDADVAGFGAASPEAANCASWHPARHPAAGAAAAGPRAHPHLLPAAGFPRPIHKPRRLGRGRPPDAELVEGMPFRNLNDNVTPVVIGGNDWAGAWAVDSRGNPQVRIGSGFAGERQREIAYRFGVNLVMHVLTGNYKSDQVHVPALLDRLGQ